MILRIEDSRGYCMLKALVLEPLSILVDRGEAEAIALAQSTPDSTVLLDDTQARRVAER
jgi:uncharacterized protein